MKQKKVDLDNHEFIEEVDESDLKDYGKNKAKIFVIILIILLVLSLIFLLFGFKLLLDRGIGDDDKKLDILNEDLFIVHSKNEFGDTISSFDLYKDESSAYNYTFYVQNNTGKPTKYFVYLTDVDFGVANNLCNKKNINYLISKNNQNVFKGVLTDEKKVKLYGTSIDVNDIDNYSVKLWAPAGCIGYLKFVYGIGD